jgi:riboflavin synthase
VFTGLIRHRGVLRACGEGRLHVACPELAARAPGGPALRIGDSVAINGACLTVATLTPDGFEADLLPDTLERTTLGRLPNGAQLNLEPALRAGDALGGHFVLGHVDGVARLLERRALPGGDWRLSFELPEWLRPWVVPQGSIAVDGVSLTIQDLSRDSFGVSLVPATWRETNLSAVQPGGVVNIEADVIVKTVRQALDAALGGPGGLTQDTLRSLGYGE